MDWYLAAAAPETDRVSEGVFECAVKAHSSGQRHLLPENPSAKFLGFLLVPFDVIDLEDSCRASLPYMFDLEESTAWTPFCSPQCVADFGHDPNSETKEASVESCGPFQVRDSKFNVIDVCHTSYCNNVAEKALQKTMPTVSIWSLAENGRPVTWNQSSLGWMTCP